MKFTYINLEGNVSQTEDVVLMPDYLEKIGETLFEKSSNVKVKEEVKETVIDEAVEERAKEYLREKKVRGFGLLKGDKLVSKAVSEGFIL